MTQENNMTALKSTATINLLAGIWLFISPWVYGSYMTSNAWNNWIVGALMVIFAVGRLSSPLTTRGLSVANLILGAWTFVTPWIYGYTAHMDRFVNSLCVGAIVFILGLYGSSVGMGRTTTGPPPLHT